MPFEESLTQVATPTKPHTKFVVAGSSSEPSSSMFDIYNHRINPLFKKIEDSVKKSVAASAVTEGLEADCQEMLSYRDYFYEGFRQWKNDQYSQRSDAVYTLPTVLNFSREMVRLAAIDSRFSPFLEFGIAVLSDNFETVQDFFLQSNKDSSNLLERSSITYAFESFSYILEYGQDDNIRQKAKSVLGENFEYMLSCLNSKDNWVFQHTFFRAFMGMYKVSSVIEQRQLHEALIKLLLSKDGSIYINYFNTVDFKDDPLLHRLEPEFIKLIRTEIERCGANAAAILQPWVYRDDMTPRDTKDLHDRRRATISDTIRNIRLIEEARPGSIKVLQERFGINHFGHYPPELLIRQHDERDDISKPYGVILGPSDDYSGVILQSRSAYKNLYDKVADKYSIRLTECDSKFGPNGIVRRLYQFANSYNPDGKGYKIGFLVIAGHGNKEGDSLMFGKDNDPFAKLRATDFSRKRVQQASEFFVENPDIVLVGCHSGKQLASSISRGLRARVFACKEAINCLIDLNPHIGVNQIIRFLPLYFPGLFAEPQETVLFVNGAQEALPPQVE